MSLQSLCKPRQSVFAADRRATVLNLDTFLKERVNGSEFFEENYFTNGMLTLVDRAFRHLGGAGAGSSVFLLSQAMGGGKDVEHEVFAVRARNEKSDFQTVIERALGIACDTLVPRGLDNSWRELSLVERYYLRALDIESRGERRKGMYEELARGFGVNDIKPLLKSDKANGARMFTASGLEASLLAPIQGAGLGMNADALPARRGRIGAAGPHPFAASPLRHMMFAIRETRAADNSPEPGRQYLRDTFGQGYWGRREGFVGLLEWLAALGNAEGMNEWISDSEAARILAGRLRNDHA